MFGNAGATGVVGGLVGSLFGFGGGGNSPGAQGGGFGFPDLAGSAGGGGIVSYDVGTDYVPRDMLAKVHRGEAIIPAGENMGRGMTVHNSFYITGAVVRRTQAQIAMEAANAIQMATRRNG